jgi:hypothetical protein
MNDDTEAESLVERADLMDDGFKFTEAGSS